jgi:hypothetical protein
MHASCVNESICFAGQSSREPGFGRVRALFCSYRMIPILWIYPTCMLVYRVLGFTVLMWAVPCVAGVVYVVLSIRSKRAKDPNSPKMLPNPSPACRINCVMPQTQLAAYGSLEDMQFEPAVQRSFSYRYLRPFMKVAAWTCFAISAVVIHYVALRIGWSSNWVNSINYVFYIGLPVSFVFVAWMCPTYLRIVPGRLDVMHLSNFGGEARIERWDLRRARILIDMSKGVVFIDERDRHGEVCLFDVSRPRRLVYCLLLGAISTHEPPPLPDDELVG